MANGPSNPDTPWWSPVDDEGELDPESWSGGMDVGLDPWLAAELGVDLTPVAGDIKALTYDMPRSLRSRQATKFEGYGIPGGLDCESVGPQKRRSL